MTQNKLSCGKCGKILTKNNIKQHKCRAFNTIIYTQYSLGSIFVIVFFTIIIIKYQDNFNWMIVLSAWYVAWNLHILSDKLIRRLLE